MRKDEFQPYLDHFIPEYVADLCGNYAMSRDAAHEKVMKALEQDFPNGWGTEKQTLLCIESNGQTVGVLWYNTDGHAAFVADFEIYAPHRNTGAGTRAMQIFEQHLAGLGITEIHLRVAGDNPRAKRLYDRAGFTVTGIRMMRVIADPEPGSGP
jgi:ribosomal protein S18 acetylase RimI-like enzyme